MPEDYSPFLDLIHDEWSICSNCFARTHTVHKEYDPLELPRSLRGVLKGDVERHRPTTETDNPPGYRPAKRRTICAECGSDRSAVLKRPVSKGLALVYGQNLVERAEEIESLSISGDLVGEIDRLKSKRDLQSDDNSIYRRAFDDLVSVRAD